MSCGETCSDCLQIQLQIAAVTGAVDKAGRKFLRQRGVPGQRRMSQCHSPDPVSLSKVLSEVEGCSWQDPLSSFEEKATAIQ